MQDKYRNFDNLPEAAHHTATRLIAAGMDMPTAAELVAKGSDYFDFKKAPDRRAFYDSVAATISKKI